jgi:hypothetical protein
MSQTPNLVKAELREIEWTDNQEVREINADKTVTVQFNPETMKVNYSVQSSGGDQRGGSASQFAGAGTTKLSLDLWFDATVPLADGSMQEEGDVRRLTEKVVYFVTPQQRDEEWIPPGVRFVWGSFLFDGRMDSLNETMDLFSEDGRPLRAQVSIGITSQKIQFEFGEQGPPGAAGGSGTPGTKPLAQVRDGDTLQSLAGRNWQSAARANDIENPRRVSPGTMLNLNPDR